MKIKYSDFFTKSKIEEIDNKIEELSKEAIAELGFSNTEKDSEEEIDLSQDQEQKVVEFIVNKEILTGEENIKHLWMAIDDINLTKINELKNNIDDKEYAETLITSLLLNSIIRNDKVIKFLLTETEISKYPALKATIILNFLDIDDKSELNEEIIELLSTDNQSAFREELAEVLWNSNIPDELFIKSFENVSDINKPLIRKVSYDKGQTFQDKEYSLLSQVIYSNRFELMQHLINKGAKMLLNEVESHLWNINISDQLLISCFENILDIDKLLIREVSNDQGQTFHNEEYSLLSKVIYSKRFELARYLFDKGVKLLFNEVEAFLWNNDISDQFLVNCLDISDINKPLVKTVSDDQSRTFHYEECSLLERVLSSNRLELAQYLAGKGARMMLSEIDSLLWYSKATDQLLINCIDISEVNKPLIRKVGYNQNGTLRDEEYSLLSGVIQHNRLELAQHLIDKGAKMLFNEVGSVLRNGKVSDQFLISCFENTADINKPLIRKVGYNQDGTLRDEEYSLLSEVIKHDRFKLAQHLIDKGAKMLLNEVESFLRNANVSDELLISGINISDINKPLIRKVSYDQGQTFSNAEYSLLEEAIQSNRLELVQHLANNGADVNFKSNAGKLYMMAYHKGIPFFDALVSSNKLIKDPDMDSYNVNLGNQISLRLSDLYDVIMWKNNFNASLSDDFEQFDKWLNDGNIHSVKSLFNAFQKFSNIKINCSEECSDAFKKAQEKYGKEVISQKTNEINESIFKIKKYFSENWEKTMLICKDFDSTTVFGIPELKICIGYKLLDSFVTGILVPKEESIEVVKLVGEDA